MSMLCTQNFSHVKLSGTSTCERHVLVADYRLSRLACLRSCRPAPVLVPDACSLARPEEHFIVTQSVNLEH